MNTRTLAVLTLIGLVGPAACERKPATPAKPASESPAPTPSPAPSQAPPAQGSGVSVMGVNLPIPEGWNQVPPANAMRLAELVVPDPAGNAEGGCSVVLSTAGGDVQANIDRWAGQVLDASGQPAAVAQDKKAIGGLTVHVAEMTGTFRGMGDVSPKENWTLRGAIVEAPGGLLFIKMTGPADAMEAAAAGWATLLDGIHGS